MRPLSLAVDLDGTIAEWRDGGRSSVGEEEVGAWIPGAREALTDLLLAGHKVVVHSCRATWPEGGGWQAIATFLRSGGFWPLLVTGNASLEEWQMLDDVNARIGSPFPWEQLDKGRAVGIWVGLGKPVADAYVDDRAVEFLPEVGWPATAELVQVMAA